jgi:hypothetical protein
MRRFLLLAVVASGAAPLCAFAQSTTSVLVELYTSQGCSSSPPADAVLSELSRCDGVIALSLHVDNRDYLGLKDEFGRPEYAARQRAYAKAVRARTLYTPQLVVQGETKLKGNEAESALARDGSALLVHLAHSAGSVGAADVQLARFISSRTVSIEAGEKAGREITYTNIVIDWRTIGR